MKKNTTLFISRTRKNYTNPLTIPESKLKIKTMVSLTLRKFCLCQQLLVKKLLEENNFLQFLQKYKYYGVD